MLLSLLISLVPTAPAPILGPLGRPAQGWFLSQVRRLNPRLADHLHNDDGPRPYTLSTLLDNRGRPIPAGTRLVPGDSCWLRLTSLEGELSQFILDRLMPRLAGQVELYKMQFRVEGYTLDSAQHPWAHSTDYARISEQLNSAPQQRTARLEFASPTAFRSYGRDLPLPLPGLLMRSYWERWNAFAPLPLQLHEAWPAFADACILVSELAGVNTERWTFAEGARGHATGFTGVVELTLQRPEKSGEWAEAWEGAPQVLGALCALAFYCGTGHHTSVGMGQTRPLPDRRRLRELGGARADGRAARRGR